MKRKMITLFLTTVAIAVLTPSTFARPEYSTEYFYFDESGTGTHVGYWYGGCDGSIYQEGELTNTYTVQMGYCPWTFEAFPTCEEVNLVSTNCPEYCVMHSYWMSVVVMKSFPDPFGCLP